MDYRTDLVDQTLHVYYRDGDDNVGIHVDHQTNLVDQILHTYISVAAISMLE